MYNEFNKFLNEMTIDEIEDMNKLGFSFNINDGEIKGFQLDEEDELDG